MYFCLGVNKVLVLVLVQCVEQYSLDFSHLVCVTTNGAPAITGQKKGAASLLVRHCEAA